MGRKPYDPGANFSNQPDSGQSTNSPPGQIRPSARLGSTCSPLVGNLIKTMRLGKASIKANTQTGELAMGQQHARSGPASRKPDRGGGGTFNQNEAGLLGQTLCYRALVASQEVRERTLGVQQAPLLRKPWAANVEQSCR